MRRLVPLVVVLGLVVANVVDVATGQDSTEWKVTVTNLTEGQPFSPPLWAVHNEDADMWSEGQLASAGLAPIVEDAVNMPLQEFLNSSENVDRARTALPPPSDPPTPPPILPGESREFTIETRSDFERLSMVWMLVRTNDGFSGLDSVTLDEDMTMEVVAYDAGTELNNEKGAKIPGPPFGNVGQRDHEVKPIARHGGILLEAPEGDIAAYRWEGAVARIEIEEE